MARRKRRTHRRRRNPVVLGNPRRRHSRRRRNPVVLGNPRRRHYRRNPFPRLPGVPSMGTLKRYGVLGLGAAGSNMLVPLAFKTLPFLGSNVVTRILTRAASVAVLGMAAKALKLNAQLATDGAAAAQFSPIINETLAVFKVPFRLGYGADDDTDALGFFTEDAGVGMLTDDDAPLALNLVE